MNKTEKVLRIKEIFDKVYADADCTLDYDNPFKLMVATQLAAQCTDKRVNMVTPSLFAKFPDVRAFADASIGDLEEAVKSTGFYHNKAKNLKLAAQTLLSDFGGTVPQTMEELLTIPGVGRKTANLLLGDAFGKPAIVVDTHAGRIVRRLGLTKETNPAKVEFELKKIVPPEYGSQFCHALVAHGRAVCLSRKPKCDKCPINHLCDFFLQNNKSEQ